MLYPSAYFDTCNGLIPQIVLCNALIQAGNEKLQAYGGILKDVSDSAQWQHTVRDDGTGYLNLSGWIPVAESRYLLQRDSIVNRVSALNSYNVALVAGSVGLPFSVFATTALNPVVLQPGIDHLSVGDLIVETRLAYLLLQLEKRNNLYKFYNFLRYAWFNSVGIPISITYDPVGGIGSSIPGTPVLFVKVIDFIFAKLFFTYPELERIIFGSIGGSKTVINKLEACSLWLQSQLSLVKAPYIPAIEAVDFISQFESEIQEMKEYKIPNPPGASFLTQVAGSDVSSEITGANNNGSIPIDEPFNFFPFVDNNPFSPLGSYGGGGEESGENLKDSEPVNSLPEC